MKKSNEKRNNLLKASFIFFALYLSFCIVLLPILQFMFGYPSAHIGRFPLHPSYAETVWLIFLCAPVVALLRAALVHLIERITKQNIEKIFEDFEQEFS